MPDTLIVTQLDRIALILLNRPERRNALNAVAMEELREALADLERDDGVRVIILGAEGPAFCAGADLDYLLELDHAGAREHLADARALEDVLAALRFSSRITIAKVQGPAIAGGCGLALACDIVVAAESARFGFPEVRLGFLPAIAAKLLIERVGAGTARELLLRGNILPPDSALDLGMINYVVADDELDPMVEKLALEVSANASPEAVRLTKQLLADIEPLGLRAGMHAASLYNALGRNTDAFRRGVKNLTEKDKPVW